MTGQGDDIVTRLREYANLLPSPGRRSLTQTMCEDAADEIERLRAEATGEPCPLIQCERRHDRSGRHR
jgi:hypothetical protein